MRLTTIYYWNRPPLNLISWIHSCWHSMSVFRFGLLHRTNCTLAQTWASAEFFPRGAKSTFCLSFSGCWRRNAHGRSQNALSVQHHKENAPCYGNSPQKCGSLAAMLLFHSCVFSHRIKRRGLLLSAVIASLHYLLRCHRCLPVLPQASLQKSLDSQKNSPDLKENR